MHLYILSHQPIYIRLIPIICFETTLQCNDFHLANHIDQNHVLNLLCNPLRILNYQSLLLILSINLFTNFFSKAMLKIIFPSSFIMSSIYMFIDTISISFVISPLTFIDISIYVKEFTIPICFIHLPITFIFSTIRPTLDTITISHVSTPLPFVSCSTFKHKIRSLFSW
jgi:hypothetical protein